MASLLSRYFHLVFTIENSSNIPQAHNVFPWTKNEKLEIQNIYDYEEIQHFEKKTKYEQVN